MKGDVPDMVRRLRLTVPDQWFADDAPLLGGVLAGLGTAWSRLYGLLDQVRLQSRLRTVSGAFLDLACVDFFGARLGRRPAEGDDALRSRLLAAMLRERGTRAGLVAAAAAAGYLARVFEPGRPADTGAYGVAAGLAWSVAGGWGSLSMPLESLVTLIEVTPTASVVGVAALAPVGAALAEALPAGGAAWVRVTAAYTNPPKD